MATQTGVDVQPLLFIFEWKKCLRRATIVIKPSSDHRPLTHVTIIKLVGNSVGKNNFLAMILTFLKNN